MLRFIHTADWQIGMTRRFLSEEAQARFTQDRIDGIRRIGELAREHGAAFVVVAGDVFESNLIERRTLLRALEAIATVPVPVIVLPGNHDPLDAASVWRHPAFTHSRPPNLVILADSAPVAVPGLGEVEVAGAVWTSKRPLEDLVGRLCAGLPPARGRMRVVLGHGAVDSLVPDSGNPALIRLAAVHAAAAEGRFHYLALGDRHSVTRVTDDNRTWYSGTHVATDFDESEPGCVLRVEFDAERPPVVDKLVVGRWSFAELAIEFASADDVAALDERLRAWPDKERSVLRLVLGGAVTLAGRARLDRLLEEQAERFASLHLHPAHPGPVLVPDHEDAGSLALGGYARAAWDELKSRAAGTEAEAITAAAALALLYRLAREETR